MTKIFSVLMLLILSSSTFTFAADKVIFFNKNSTAASRAQSVKKMGAAVKRDMPEIYAVAASFPGTVRSAFQISSAKAADPSLVAAEDDDAINWLWADQFNTSLKRIFDNPQKINITPITTNVEATPGLDTQMMPWGIGRVESNAAWKRGYTGKGVVVAVVDTGIKLDHPDLKDNIIGNYNATDESKPANDGHGHGTHVAGTIAALKNKIGVVGIAHEAKLLAVKALSDSGPGTAADIAAGIIWAANNGANVINMSLGSGIPKKVMEEAINYAVSKNVTVVCAAGNNAGPVSWPAAFSNTIAVSASDKFSAIAKFSNTGKEIDFIAPGVEILSTYAKQQYATLNGTSMASPHIAGLAALAVQAGAKTPAQVLAALKTASRPLKDLTKNQQGNGFVKGRWIGK